MITITDCVPPSFMPVGVVKLWVGNPETYTPVITQDGSLWIKGKLANFNNKDFKRVIPNPKA